MKVRPPVERLDESAGYLGYYTRTHLSQTFDLVDVDGTSPVVWIYGKSETGTLRMIEEKPGNQRMHSSQERVLRWLTGRYPGLAVYVLYDADRLVTLDFPIRLMRLATGTLGDVERTFERSQFDAWLLDGLVSPETIDQRSSWNRLCDLTGLPFNLSGLPKGVDADTIDEALTRIASAMSMDNVEMTDQ